MSDIATTTYFDARRGLRAVADRLRAGPCQIAYAGNSVTAQRDGYVGRLHNSLVEWSGKRHLAIQAGLSGMGSMGCLFTLDRFVLSRKPALCFVECMVGDSGSKPPLESIEPVLEGIVRKLSAADCACCFLHAYRGDLTPDDLQPLLDKYEKVADHYGIPSIQIGLAVANGEASGAWSIDELFLDRLHTTPKGAQVMANLTTQAMQQILALRQPSHKTVLHPRLHVDDLEGARLLLPDANMTMLPDAFQTGRFRLVLSLIDLESGNGLCIEAAPSDIWGLLVVAGPRSGDILIEANGTRQEYRTWDKWCDRELLRSVTFAEPVRRGAEFRLLVTDRGGLETSHPKLLRVVGLMLADDSRGAAPACQNRGDV